MPRESRLLYRFIGGNLALDFANTVHTFGLPDPRDEWRSAADVIVWAGRAGALSRAECHALGRATAANPRIARLVLSRSRSLRRLVYDIFAGAAETGQPPHQVLVRFNALFSEVMWRTEIVQRDGRYAVVPVAGLDPSTRLTSAIVRAAAELLTGPDIGRVRQCGDAYCSWLFVDTSRNGSRRWCSMELCGNRARVRALRRRRGRPNELRA
jgi:predicted RNA-binding Zn ribbon-like protein